MPAEPILNAAGFLQLGSAIEQLSAALERVPGGAGNACFAAPPGAPEPAQQFNELTANWTGELLNIAAHAGGLSKAMTSVGNHLSEVDDQVAANLPG